MEVPCPVPLTKPWSPVGYQVVELTDKNSPAQQPAQVILLEPAAKPLAKNAIPRSPVGYRVVTVADDIVSVPQKEPGLVRGTRLRADDIRLLMPRRRTSPWAIWVPIATVAAVLSVPALSLALLLSQAQSRHQRQMAAAVAPEAVVPDAIRANAPAEKKAAEPAVANIDAVVAAPPLCDNNAADIAGDPFDGAHQAKPAQPPRRDHEGFETRVHFVRNPQEAARLAKQEHKLTFILHLSGNFEDPGFT